MKIKIKESVGKQEILEFISKALNTLEEAGVDEFKGVNFYFNPYASGEKVVPQINGEAFNFQFISSKKHIEYTTEKDGSKKATYKKSTASDINLNGILQLNQPVELPTQELLDLEEAERITLAKERHKKLEAEHNERLRKQREIERQDKQIGQECSEKLCEILGLSAEEFKSEKSSVGWVKTEKGIQKYCGDLTDNRVFRISMKIKGRKEKMVYLFSENARVLYEGIH